MLLFMKFPTTGHKSIYKEGYESRLKVASKKNFYIYFISGFFNQKSQNEFCKHT